MTPQPACILKPFKCPDIIKQKQEIIICTACQVLPGFSYFTVLLSFQSKAGSILVTSHFSFFLIPMFLLMGKCRYSMEIKPFFLDNVTRSDLKTATKCLGFQQNCLFTAKSLYLAQRRTTTQLSVKVISSFNLFKNVLFSFIKKIFVSLTSANRICK